MPDEQTISESLGQKAFSYNDIFFRYKFEVINGLKVSIAINKKYYIDIFQKEITGWKSGDKIPDYRKMKRRYFKAGLHEIDKVWFKNPDDFNRTTYLGFPLSVKAIQGFLDKFDTWFHAQFLVDLARIEQALAKKEEVGLKLKIEMPEELKKALSGQ